MAGARIEREHKPQRELDDNEKVILERWEEKDK